MGRWVRFHCSSELHIMLLSRTHTHKMRGRKKVLIEIKHPLRVHLGVWWIFYIFHRSVWFLSNTHTPPSTAHINMLCLCLFVFSIIPISRGETSRQILPHTRYKYAWFAYSPERLCSQPYLILGRIAIEYVLLKINIPKFKILFIYNILRVCKEFYNLLSIWWHKYYIILCKCVN